MSRRIEKLTPDNELKGLILTAVSHGNRISVKIIQHVISTPYQYVETDGEVTENWYGGDAGAIRTAITRLKNAGYLSLYERNEKGEITSYKTQKRPYNYYLTALGRVHEQNPYVKKEHREERISDEAWRLMRELLQNEETFQEAVKEYTRTHEVPKINITNSRGPIIRNPRVKGKGGKITIVHEDGTAQEVSTDKLQSALKDIDALKIRADEQNQTIIAQQWEKAGYEQQIADLVYALEGKDINLANIKRRNTGAMRTAQRKDLVYMVTDGINPDELDGEYYVEIPVGADFFNAWGNIWGRKVKGATLLNRSSFELMSDTNTEVERGHANHELSYNEMDAVGLYITKIRPTGITVDAENSRMLKAIALKW